MDQTITRAQLRQLMEAGRLLHLVEALPPRHFAAGHLPGAVNIPHEAVRELAPGLLPDKDALVVVYCANAACRNSRIAAATLRQMGYADVKEYADGKQDWLDGDLALEHDLRGGS